jgi:hypothetical protein
MKKTLNNTESSNSTKPVLANRILDIRRLNIIPLKWEKIVSQFNTGWMAKIPGLKATYFIFVDLETGKTKLSDLENKHRIFDSVDVAKEWCETDFKETIGNLLIIDYPDSSE